MWCWLEKLLLIRRANQCENPHVANFHSYNQSSMRRLPDAREHVFTDIFTIKPHFIHVTIPHSRKLFSHTGIFHTMIQSLKNIERRRTASRASGLETPKKYLYALHN